VRSLCDAATWHGEQPHLTHVLRVSLTAVAREHALRGAPDEGIYHAMIRKPVPLATLVEQMAALLR
jgi:hypothetical protein